MGLKSAVGRTKGLYMYTVSPFYQRPFKGWGREMVHIVRSHLGWALFATSISVGAYSLVQWTNHDFHRRGLKNPADFEQENGHHQN